MTTTLAFTLTSTGHWFSDQKEEVYFTAEMDVPRVGHVKTRFHADRYVARFYNDGPDGPDYKGRAGWTSWRIILDSHNLMAGVGPKTQDVMRAAVEPAIMAWLTGPQYAPSRQAEVARFIAREAQERYGLVSAKRYFAKYQDELSDADRDRLTRGLDALERAGALLG
jgi:hypothetical protein